MNVLSDNISLDSWGPHCCVFTEAVLNEWMVEWMVFGFEPFWARCTQTLKQALCAPLSITRLKQTCSFTKVPDGPYLKFPDILGAQKEGTQMCMSEWSQDLTLTQNVDWGFPLSTTLPTVGLLLRHMAYKCLLKMLCPVRRLITLDRVLLKDNN
jgi:hypothetical protein